ncbi:MAG: hypothetical protein K8S14_00820 [Actinomycetia bacterium]|nr:hypothetical protein [Actinomycetes bacterium]
MKKIILILILLVLIPAATLAFEDCPYDKADCAFPGECSRYIDADNDGICDKSQPAPEDRSNDTTTAKDDTVTAAEDSTITTEDMTIATGAAAIAVAESNSGDQIPEAEVETDNQSKITYHLLLIFLVLIALYTISYILSRKKIIRVATHRKIWNIILLVSFLISGLLGVLLVIRINYGVEMPMPFNVLYWHVEIGIAMFIISLFHTFWHGAYFKRLFKIK